MQQGKISGNGGCNSYFGSYRAAGQQIHFGNIGSTMMACAEHRKMQLEQQFFERLGQTASYRLNAGKLQLLNAHGKPLLLFAPLNR